MRIDKNPKSVVCILSALGVFVIGVVLTLAFFGNTSLLGVGVAMAVIGGAGAILGCINLMAKREDERDDAKAEAGEKSVAPGRIPPPREFRYRESYAEANRGALYYQPCTSSPSRRETRLPHESALDPMHEGAVVGDGPGSQRGFYDLRQAAAGGIIFVSPGKPSSNIMVPISPLDDRSFPVPSTVGSPLPTFSARRRPPIQEDEPNETRHVDPPPAVAASRPLPPAQVWQRNPLPTSNLPPSSSSFRPPFQLRDDARTPMRNADDAYASRWSPAQ